MKAMIACRKRKQQTNMKTKQQVLDNMQDDSSRALSKTVKDSDWKEGIDLSVHLPIAASVREWPEEMIDSLVLLAGRHLLQHGASAGVRAHVASLSAKDKEGKPAKVVPLVTDVYLAEDCAKERISKALLEKVTAMLDALTKGGDTVNKGFIKGAKTYGIKWPADAGDVTEADCLAYQQAKVRCLNELA
jgi:hypothetical protein